LPEGGRHAPVLIATSWQALNRALTEGPETRLCNCTIVILFAGFYIEANLNHIIEQTHSTRRMKTFLGQKYPGVQDKIAWFYNEFVARSKAADKKALYKQGVRRKIRRRFPGFARLYLFRNDLSHGVVNKSARSLPEAQQLRQHAKDIVSSLFDIAARRGYSIPRDTNYYDAIAD
jgi:hypothetical protein